MNQKIQRSSPIDWIVAVEAVGSPAMVNLATQNLYLQSENIRFDAADGVLEAKGQSGVVLQRDGAKFSFPKFVYQFDPKNPSTIGSIDIPGPGRVQMDDPKLPIRSASWTTGLRVQPKTMTTAANFSSDVEFWIDGNVNATLVDGGSFNANALWGYLKPVIAATNSVHQNPGVHRKSAFPEMRPDRVQATGNIRINTSALDAETELLNLFFTHQPVTGLLPSDEQPTSPTPMRQWVSQPKSTRGLVTPVAKNRPVIRGNSVSAQININTDGATANDLSVVGDVEIQHSVEISGNQAPVKLTGQELRLIDGGGKDILQLSGGPNAQARFELDDGYFIGPKIQIRLSDNLVWIDEAGEFQMPLSILPKGLVNQQMNSGRVATSQAITSSMKPPNLTWIKAPKCRWSGDMTFDGKEIRIRQNVDITASLENQGQPWDMFIKGDQLTVALTDGIQLSDMQTLQSATVAEVSLTQLGDQPVTVEALCRAPDGILESRHLMHAPKLTLLPTDGGNLVGSGPGWYRMWTRAKANPVVPDDSKLPNRPDGPELTAIHLVYQEGMVGNMAQKDLTFTRGVRVGVKEVASWQSSFDIQKMTNIELGTGALDCHQLRLGMDPQSMVESSSVTANPPAWEMEATGGIAFRFRNANGLYESTASRAAYSSTQTRFIVEESPSKPIQMNHTTPTGATGFNGEFKIITYNSETMEFDAVPYRFSPGQIPTTARPATGTSRR